MLTRGKITPKQKQELKSLRLLNLLYIDILLMDIKAYPLGNEREIAEKYRELNETIDAILSRDK